MTNTNCLEGVACPDCGNDAMFYIEVTTLAVVTDDGAEIQGGMEWDDDSYAQCAECGRIGKLAEFTIEPATDPNPTTEENNP